MTHPNFKGDAATPEAKRHRARVLYPLADKCERCDDKAVDRHHIDGDTGNNRPENIAHLCRRCHMTVDGRLEKFKEVAAANGRAMRKPPRPCAHCGRKAKRLARGQCSACNEYERRRGTPRPLDGNYPRRVRKMTQADEDQVRLRRSERAEDLAAEFGVSKSRIYQIWALDGPKQRRPYTNDRPRRPDGTFLPKGAAA